MFLNSKLEAVPRKSVVRKQDLLANLLTLAGSIVAVIMLMPISKDIGVYQEMFTDMSYQEDVEYLFRYWLNIGSTLHASFSLTLLPLIFLTFNLKIKALKYLGAQSLGYVFLTYIAVFYLLHECAQLRISCALAFALWSCIAIMSRRWAYAILLCIMAIGFHITSVLLPLVFGFCCHNKTINKFSWLLLFLGVLIFLLKISIMDMVVVPVIMLLDGRYLAYISLLIEEQNSSGLFLVYASLLASLLIYLYFWGRLNSKRLPDVYWVLLSTCVYGCSLLFLFYETVAVASRLSDVLVILIIPLIAIVITKLQLTSRCIVFMLLGGFFSARIYQLYWL
jgi:hypothetical protein